VTDRWRCAASDPNHRRPLSPISPLLDDSVKLGVPSVQVGVEPSTEAGGVHVKCPLAPPEPNPDVELPDSTDSDDLLSGLDSKRISEMLKRKFLIFIRRKSRLRTDAPNADMILATINNAVTENIQDNDIYRREARVLQHIFTSIIVEGMEVFNSILPNTQSNPLIPSFLNPFKRTILFFLCLYCELSESPFQLPAFHSGFILHDLTKIN